MNWWDDRAVHAEECLSATAFPICSIINYSSMWLLHFIRIDKENGKTNFSGDRSEACHLLSFVSDSTLSEGMYRTTTVATFLIPVSFYQILPPCSHLAHFKVKISYPPPHYYPVSI